jgi:hypothetical protein
MHGRTAARLISSHLLSQTQLRVTRWVEHPARTSALLRRAQRDFDTCAVMYPPAS